LSLAKRFAFVFEIVPSAESLDVAGITFHQPIEGSVGRQNVLRLRWLGGICGQGLLS
jgi:ribosomal protein S7